MKKNNKLNPVKSLMIGLLVTFFRALKWQVIRQMLMKLIANLEGGEAYSKTIRELIQKKYRLQIGMYSYGGCF